MQMPDDPGGRRYPFVTIVMPVRNEAEFIAESLDAVLNQDYPRDRMEIIVADGMSNDGTREIVKELAEAHPDLSLTLLENPGRIVSTGLNLAIARAHGEIVIRVDGHSKVAPDYVSRCVHHLMNDGIVGVGGPIRTLGRTSVGRAIAAAMSSRFGVGGSAFRTVKDRSAYVDTIAFPAYTRAALERAGRFDEDLVRNQDDEYNYRLRGMGGRLLMAEDVRSEYYARDSFKKLWRQYFQYGLYKVRVMQKHPRQMSLRQFVPPVFAMVLVGGAVASPFGGLGMLAFSLVLGLYGIAVIIATALAAGRLSLRETAALLAIFPTLHLSYGFGFLVGLTCFGLTWPKRSAATAAEATLTPVQRVAGSLPIPSDTCSPLNKI